MGKKYINIRTVIYMKENIKIIKEMEKEQNSDKYEEEYKHNKRKRKRTRTFKWKNGDIYEEEYKGGKRNGVGIMTYYNKVIHGIWENDLFIKEL